MHTSSLPFTTRISGADLLDLEVSSLRIPDINNVFQMLNIDSPLMWRVLNSISRGADKTQAIYYWREDESITRATTVTTGSSATDTTIAVADAKHFVVNSMVYCFRTLENMFVTAVNTSTNIITVTRGFPDGVNAAALVAGDKLMAGTAQLPEEGDANGGNSILPAGLRYNYVGFFSESVTVTDRQNKSKMMTVEGSEVGTMAWAVQQKLVDMMIKLNRDVLFSRKGITSTANGDITSFDGFFSFLDGNALTLDGYNQSLNYPELSEFVDSMCEPDASSDTKIAFFGNSLYAACRRVCRAAGIETPTYYNPDFGAGDATSFELLTEEGNRLVVMRDKYGFSSEAGMSGCGIITDPAHIEMSGYTGTPLAWRQNIQAPDSHVLKDELWGSMTIQVTHPSCHGAIYDAPRKIIAAQRF